MMMSLQVTEMKPQWAHGLFVKGEQELINPWEEEGLYILEDKGEFYFQKCIDIIILRNDIDGKYQGVSKQLALCSWMTGLIFL